MLLTVDVGNTNITFALFKDRKVKFKFDIPSCNYNRRLLKKRLSGLSINDSIICSVVPKINPLLIRDLRIITGKKPYLIGKDIRVPLINKYRKQEQVGQDRLVNAYAALNIYKNTPLVVIDFGTAITFDIISVNKAYLGGMIIPGLRISLEALNQRTALLPKTILRKPKEFIGRDTKSSMLSGIIYGFSSMTDELISRIKKKMGANTIVIGTGGNIDLISPYCRRINFINKNLTLEGLKLLCNLKKNT